MKGRVLIVAGSDSGGGAGIQADIKTVTALGGYAMTAITALTAQDTSGVHGVVGIDPGFIQQQMRLVLADIGADCIKTGMLHTAAVIEAVAAVLQADAPGVPVVADPVMVAKGGAALLDDGAEQTLVRRLAPLATLLTPNAPEAGRLAGMAIATLDDMRAAARRILGFGCRAVLVKGGHLPGPAIHNLLATDAGERVFETPRIDTPHTHGTGCTLASAIATGIAQGLPLDQAVARASAYLAEAIRRAPGFGRGHGPVDHGHTVRPFP